MYSLHRILLLIGETGDDDAILVIRFIKQNWRCPMIKLHTLCFYVYLRTFANLQKKNVGNIEHPYSAN